MKTLWKIGEAIWAVTNVLLGMFFLGFIVYMFKQHVTCVDLIQWCVIH